MERVINGKNPVTVSDFSIGTASVAVTSINDTAMAMPIGAEATMTKPQSELATLNLDCVANSLFSYDVEIEYIDQDTGATYTFIGTQKLEGTCAQ